MPATLSSSGDQAVHDLQMASRGLQGLGRPFEVPAAEMRQGIFAAAAAVHRHQERLERAVLIVLAHQFEQLLFQDFYLDPAF